MNIVSILAVVVAVIAAWVMTSEISAQHEDHPMYQPLAHDVADIPPIEMTGQAAVAVWMECTILEPGWKVTPGSCEGQDLPYMEMHGYSFTAVPGILTEERNGYNDWSTETSNSRVLRAFWIVDKPIYEHNTSMSMLIHASSGGYQYQWLDYETGLDEYLIGTEFQR